MFTLAVWPRLRGVSALIKGAIVVTAFLGLLPATAHGELVYVSDLGANAVVVKDSSNGNEVARIAMARPIGIALNSTTRRGYISASGSGAVYVIDLDTNAVIPPAISVGGGPHGSALNEQTNRLYVANYAGGYVSVINTATNTLITNVSTGSLPFSVAVVKNTDKAYVANRNNVAEVDGLTNTVTRYFPLASANTGDITYASTVNKLFTADADAETVSVINLSTGAVSAVSLGRTPIRGFGPQGVAFDPGTNRVIVSTGDGWLFAIDATTEQIVASVRVATELSRLRISPSTRRIYAPSGTGTVYMVDADSLAPAGTLTGFVNAGYAVAAPSPTAPPGVTAAFQWPLRGVGVSGISQDYAHWNDFSGNPRRYHTGLDISAPKGMEVYPSANGEIFAITEYGQRIDPRRPCIKPTEKGISSNCMDHGYGNTVIIRHLTPGSNEAIFSQYSHLSEIVGKWKTLCVRESGARQCATPVAIGAGEVIGKVGGSCYNSLDCTSPHLHFEMKRFSTLAARGDDVGTEFGYTDNHPDENHPLDGMPYGYIDPISKLHQIDRAGFPRPVRIQSQEGGARLRYGPGALNNDPYDEFTSVNNLDVEALGQTSGTTNPSCPEGWYQVRRSANHCREQGACFVSNQVRLPDAWVCRSVVAD